MIFILWALIIIYLPVIYFMLKYIDKYMDKKDKDKLKANSKWR